MASTEGQHRPWGFSKKSLNRMLDIERKQKIDRMQAATTTLPVQPSRISTSNDIYGRRASNFIPEHRPEHRPAPLHSHGRAMTVPALPSSTAAAATQAPAGNPVDTSAEIQPKTPGTLKIEVLSKDNDDDGNGSDVSSICQSPGWDDSKTRKEKKEAKEARDKRRKEKARAEKEAKDAKKHANAKKLHKPPPTNKVFDKMNAGVAPMERSTSAPILVTISEQRPAGPESPRPRRNSRRESIEIVVNGLKNISGPWKQDKPQSPTEAELPVGTGGFVGGLKLTRQNEGAVQDEIQRHTTTTTNTALLEQIQRDAGAPPAQRVPEYLKFESTMPPASSESEAEEEIRTRNNARGNGEEVSYTTRLARDLDAEKRLSAGSSIMERKIKRRPKSKISSGDQLRLDARNGFGPLPTEDGILQEFTTLPEPPGPKSRRRNIDPIRISGELEEMPVSPHSPDGQFVMSQSAREQSRGRPATTVLQHERKPSNQPAPLHAKPQNRPPEGSSSARPKHSTVESDNDQSPSHNSDGYHSFMAHSQTMPNNKHLTQATSSKDDKSSKNYPMSPSFKNFKSAAKAAFSRNSYTSNVSSKSSSQGSSSLTSSPNNSNTTLRVLSKAERLLGEAMPPVPPMPPPETYANARSRTSHPSSLRSSSEDNSYASDSGTNVTTPSASRPHSQKDELYATKDFKSTAAASILSEKMQQESGSAGDNSSMYDAFHDAEEVLGNAEYIKSSPELLMHPALRPKPQVAMGSAVEKSLESDLNRRSSLSRSVSTPDMNDDLSFLPTLKHQALGRRLSKGKGKEEPVNVARQASEPDYQDKDSQSTSKLPPRSQSSDSTSSMDPASGKYLQDARKNIPNAGPLSKVSKAGRVAFQQAPAASHSFGPDPIAKMFVVCCSCHYFHDMPSKIYECMAKPYNVVEDKDLGVSGKMTTAILCPWCSHSMTTQCCAGYAAVVVMQEKLH